MHQPHPCFPQLAGKRGPQQSSGLPSDLYITGSGYLLDLQACQHGLVDPAKRKARASVSARAEGSPLGPNHQPDESEGAAGTAAPAGSSPPAPEGRAVSSGRAGATQNPEAGTVILALLEVRKLRLRRAKSMSQPEARYPTPDPGIVSTSGSLSLHGPHSTRRL